MKVLFLDIDGVLNSKQSNDAFRRFYGRNPLMATGLCPIACSNLLMILEEVPDLKIVISSTWRIGTPLEEMRDTLQRDVGVERDRVIGCTPFLGYDAERGDEILDWLNRHPQVSQFIIVDDESDMGSVAPHLVKIDTNLGLMLYEAEEIVRRFKA